MSVTRTVPTSKAQFPLIQFVLLYNKSRTIHNKSKVVQQIKQVEFELKDTVVFFGLLDLTWHFHDCLGCKNSILYAFLVTRLLMVSDNTSVLTEL